MSARVSSKENCLHLFRDSGDLIPRSFLVSIDGRWTLGLRGSVLIQILIQRASVCWMHTSELGSYRAPLHDECSKHHGHKEDHGVTPGTPRLAHFGVENDCSCWSLWYGSFIDHVLEGLPFFGFGWFLLFTFSPIVRPHGLSVGRTRMSCMFHGLFANEGVGLVATLVSNL